MADVTKFITEFIDNAKCKITELAKTELENTEKKHQLDMFIASKVTELVGKLKLGWFTKLVISRCVVPNISIFTQHIYDLLKAKVEGVTK